MVMSEGKVDNRRIFSRWVRATWIGWILSIPLIAAFALLGEAVGIGGAQVLVGIGLGTGIGLMQGRVIRSVLHRFAPWFWSCAIGLAVPFLAADIVKATGREFAYSQQASVALGGIVVGIWQSFILRSHLHRTRWWIVGSAVGWTLAAATAASADFLSRSKSLRGLWGALIYLGLITGGGLILGLVTGLLLVWDLRDEPAT